PPWLKAVRVQWCWPYEMLTKQQYADRCLIVVGCGGEADELLCKRRLSAGGRLAHITCEGENDPRVSVHQRGQLGRSFFWQPPALGVPVSALGKKIGALKRRRFTKTGPDAVALRDDQTLTIYDQGGDLRHLRVFNDEGACEVEMSGEVVHCPSLQLAQDMDVGVRDECLKAFGTYSFRYLIPSILIQCALQMLRFMAITYLESCALTDPETFWWRPILPAVQFLFLANLVVCHMFNVFLTGDDKVSWVDRIVGNLSAAIFLLGTMYLEPRLPPIYVAHSGVVGLFISQPFLHYYKTMATFPTRRLLPSLRWAMCCIAAILGAAISNTVIGVVYGAMLQTGAMPLRASLFLPLATATCEVFTVVWVKHSYNWIVWPRRKMKDEDGCDGNGFEGSVLGDNFFLPAATLIMAANALAESIRMAATFSVAASTGSYAWTLSVPLSMMLNVATRLGWMRFVRFGTLKRLGWVQMAVKMSGPTSWTMLHENMKIYGGYSRFAAVLALITSRAVMHGVSVNPIFNASAGYALLAMLAAEVVEDFVVLWELLPTAPIPQEVIWRDEAFDNSTPLQLVAVEHCRSSLGTNMARSARAKPTGDSSRVHPDTFNSVCPSMPADAMISVASLGPHQERWRSVTSWLGQPRVLNPALPLHGLRELPFHIQLGSVGVMVEVTFGVLFVLLGPGFALGLVEDSCASRGQTDAESLFFWSIPLSC
ncbi:unnamed protein product, partial [Effrenium voratum]